jgi:hypothetical protein
MKQAREIAWGAKRREGAKPWGRNGTSVLGTRWSSVAPRGCENAEGDKTSEGTVGSLWSESERAIDEQKRSQGRTTVVAYR